MYTRFLTYDLKDADSSKYADLYALIDKYNGVKITESTYKIKTSDNWDTFMTKFKRVTHSGDNVKVIVLIDNDNTNDKEMAVWTIR